ncbi:DNA-processing protein DprA [bacterium]|nr:DNA-processing protein DprA [bacterium]
MAIAPDAALALLTIAELPRVGERRLQRLREHAERRRLPLALLADLPTATLREELALPWAAIRRLRDERVHHATRCAALAAALADAGVRLCPLGDPQYPPGWARCGAPPPPLAYLHGDPGLLRRPIVALLHSRLVDATTVTGTLRLARAVAAAGCALAVGGMKTTHRVAAAAARNLGAPRLIVLDRGLLAAFGGHLDRDPFGLGPRRAPFDPTGTLVLSSFRPDDHAVPRSGRRRDALIAALADLVVAVHARPGGEIERVCHAALARGQRVAVWRAHNRGLVAAGGLALDEPGLATALAALVRPASARRR